MSDDEAFGQLPASSALAEAELGSLNEQLSRDPERYQQQDRRAIIEALRQQRKRFEEAERLAGSKPKPKIASKLMSETKVAAEDMGL